MGSHTTIRTPTLSYNHRWLTLQGRSLKSATKGCLVATTPITGDNRDAPSQIYFWPDETDDTGELRHLCQRVEKENKGIILFKAKN